MALERARFPTELDTHPEQDSTIDTSIFNKATGVVDAGILICRIKVRNCSWHARVVVTGVLGLVIERELFNNAVDAENSSRITSVALK